MGLTTYQEERVWISDFESQFLLFIFIDPNCPITQKYIPKINSLTEKYDLLVYGVQPNLGIYYDEVMKFKDDYDFKFPVINDSTQKLTYYFNASVTPEVFLLDKSGTLIYSGAIDNWFFDLGRYRKSATVHYLRDALTQTTDLYFQLIITRKLSDA